MGGFNLKGLALIWLSVLLLAFLKMMNKFISLLLTLEMFSLLGLTVVSNLTFLNNSCSLMFILMSLSVGEGVLGLALLVSFVRENSAEQTSAVFL